MRVLTLFASLTSLSAYITHKWCHSSAQAASIADVSRPHFPEIMIFTFIITVFCCSDWPSLCCYCDWPAATSVSHYINQAFFSQGFLCRSQNVKLLNGSYRTECLKKGVLCQVQCDACAHIKCGQVEYSNYAGWTQYKVHLNCLLLT